MKFQVRLILLSLSVLLVLSSCATSENKELEDRERKVEKKVERDIRAKKEDSTSEKKGNRSDLYASYPRLRTLEEDEVSLGQISGESPCLIVFWATWCAICRREIPHLRELEKKYGPSGRLKVVAVSVGQKADLVNQYRRKWRLDYTVLLDQKGAFSKAWKVKQMPTNILVDSGGKILYRGRAIPFDKISALVKK